MLPGQHIGRGHHGRLRACFDRRRHGERGDHRLPASDIALQKPQHAARREHVGLDLGERLLLRPGEGIGERAAHPLCEMSVASKRPPRKLPVAAPDERDGELRGEDLIEGEPLPRLRPQRKVRRRLWTMQDVQRAPEGRPAFRFQKRSLLPLRKVRQPWPGHRP